MAFEKLSNSLNELNQNIRAFAHSNTEYYKLQFFKQASKGVISLVLFLILGVLLLFALIMLSVAVSIALSVALDSPSIGYFIVAGFYILLFLLVLIFGKKPLTRTILKKFSRSFFKE